MPPESHFGLLTYIHTDIQLKTMPNFSIAASKYRRMSMRWEVTTKDRISHRYVPDSTSSAMQSDIWNVCHASLRLKKTASFDTIMYWWMLDTAFPWARELVITSTTSRVLKCIPLNRCSKSWSPLVNWRKNSQTSSRCRDFRWRKMLNLDMNRCIIFSFYVHCFAKVSYNNLICSGTY